MSRRPGMCARVGGSRHRETDLQFLERLAAEEGWHYRYQHGDTPKLAPVTRVIIMDRIATVLTRFPSKAIRLRS
ncbi:hypothetical protein [Marinobacter sp.]|uniref:hypothetical protein n=1 Tax=Marinobacter sp. TaxID=50741 RepID=UPI00356B01C7